jgi:hypothetical protein
MAEHYELVVLIGSAERRMSELGRYRLEGPPICS